MSSEMSVLELRHLVYVSEHILSLQKREALLKRRVLENFPEGTTRIDTDAGAILVSVSNSGGVSQVSARYEDW